MTGQRRDGGFIARGRADRRARAAMYAAVAVYWLLLAVTSADWMLWLALFNAGAFGFCTVWELRSWRRSGRYILRGSDAPPALSPDLLTRVTALTAAGDRIEAVRLVRAETRAGLLAAKRAVDAVDD